MNPSEVNPIPPTAPPDPSGKPAADAHPRAEATLGKHESKPEGKGQTQTLVKPQSTEKSPEEESDDDEEPSLSPPPLSWRPRAPINFTAATGTPTSGRGRGRGTK